MQTSDRFLQRAAILVVLLGTIFQLVTAQSSNDEQYYPQTEQGATLRQNPGNMQVFQESRQGENIISAGDVRLMYGASDLSPQNPGQVDLEMDFYQPEYNTTTTEHMVCYFLGAYHSRVEVMNRHTGIGYGEVYVGVWRYQTSSNGKSWRSTNVYKSVHLLPGSTCQEYVDSILEDPIYTQLESRLIAPSKLTMMDIIDYDENTTQQINKTVYVRLVFCPYDTQSKNGVYRR